MNSVEVLAEPLVEIDGAPLSTEDARTLVEIRVQQRLSTPAMCELTFVGSGAAIADDQQFRAGAALRVTLNGHTDGLFEGEITAMEFAYPPSGIREIRVRAFDVLHRLRKRQATRTHIRVTPKALAEEMVANLGLNVLATDPGPLRQIVIQQNQSDWDLLLEETQSCGLFLTLRDKHLHLCTLEGLGEKVTLKWGESLLEAYFEVNAEAALRSVAVACWNPTRVEHHEGRATGARTGREVIAAAAPDRFGTNGDLLLSDELGANGEFAQAIAQAELDRRTANEVVFRGTAQGDPRLRPGTRVTASGVNEQFTGSYVVASVNHLIDRRVGYISELQTSVPARRPRNKGALATKGVVSAVNDPESLGRLRVSLPTYNNVETDWMEVLTTGAGAKKGLLMPPDLGDQVLVLLIHGDPAQGVVLGGLYGADGPPETALEDGGIRCCTLLTSKGQKVVLDDSGERIRFENSNGSYVELAPKKVHIYSTTDLDIEAPGHAVVISGQTIDFRKA